jgi:hypothetical protein
MLALNEALGDCVDVSQSLVSSSEYIVFSSEYGGELPQNPPPIPA